MLRDLGLKLDWLKNPDKGLSLDVKDAIAGIFYVENAKEAIDSQNRKIIASQDFVEKYKVHTVFGVGGRYMLGGKNMIIIIFFTREKLSINTVRHFIPLINLFKIYTIKLASHGKIFSDQINSRISEL